MQFAFLFFLTTRLCNYSIIVLGLPNELMKNLQEANSQFQKVKDTIQNLEEVLSKARKLQEQKLILQAGSNYLPMEEIEMIIQKSEAKIEDAKLLHQLIEELMKRSCYMTKDEIQSLSENLQTFQTRLQIGELMLDGASGSIYNEEVYDDNTKVDDNKKPRHDEEEVDADGVDTASPELVTKQS